MDNTTYQSFKRIAAVCVGITLMVVSAKFSVIGFNFQIDGMNWVGWVMAVAIIAIELIWNSERKTKNLTLVVIGIGAYIYGMWTNISGIHASQGGAAEFQSWVFPALLGIALEIIPEPLIIWGLISDVGDHEADFLHNILSLFDTDRRGRPRYNRETVNRPSMRIHRPPITKPITDEMRQHLYTNRNANETRNSVNKNQTLLDRQKEMDEYYRRLRGETHSKRRHDG